MSCSTCGAQSTGRGKFCGTCGAPVEPAATSVPQAAETWIGDLDASADSGPGTPTTNIAAAADAPAAPGVWWAEGPAAPVEYGEHAAPTVVPAYAGYRGGTGLPYEPTLVQDPHWYSAAHGSDIPASFGRRFAARVIDYLLIWAITIALILGCFTVFAAVIDNGPDATDFGGDLTNFGTAIVWAFVVAWVAASFLPGFLTLWLGQGGAGAATPGRLAVGIRLVRANGNERVGYGRSLGRMLASALDMLFALSSLSMLWDREKRTWHDRLSGTAVVRTGVGLRPSRPGSVWTAFGVAVAVTAVIACGAPVVARVAHGDDSELVSASDNSGSDVYYSDPSGGGGDAGSSSETYTAGDTSAPVSTRSPSPRPDLGAASGSVAEALSMDESTALAELNQNAASGLQRYRAIDAVYALPQLVVACTGSESADVRNGAGRYGIFDGEEEEFPGGMGASVVLALYRALVEEASEHSLFLLNKADIISAGVDQPMEGCGGSPEFLVLVDELLGDAASPDEETANKRADVAAATWCRERGSARVNPPSSDTGESAYRRCLARNVGDRGNSYDAAG